MTATKNIAQAAALCIGLFAANMVWSVDCPEGVRASNAQKLDVAQAKAPLASDMHKLFHEAHLNEPDDLGDYVQNFQMDRLLSR